MKTAQLTSTSWKKSVVLLHELGGERFWKPLLLLLLSRALSSKSPSLLLAASQMLLLCCEQTSIKNVLRISLDEAKKLDTFFGAFLSS